MATFEPKDMMVRVIRYDSARSGFLNVLFVSQSGELHAGIHVLIEGSQQLDHASLTQAELGELRELFSHLSTLPASDSTNGPSTDMKIELTWQTSGGYRHWQHEFAPAEALSLINFLEARVSPTFAW